MPARMLRRLSRVRTRDLEGRRGRAQVAGAQRCPGRAGAAATFLGVVGLFLCCGLGWAVSGLAAGCAVSDMDFSGKRCDEAHACPAGYLCVTRPVSAGESQGLCYRASQAPACPAARFCPEGGAWVEVCAQDGLSSAVVEECEGPAVCNPDAAVCSGPCVSAEDCGAEEMCDTGTGLCRPAPGVCQGAACRGGTCQEKTCVLDPGADAVSPDGSASSLDCFFAIPTPPATPESCALSGRVNLFPSIPTDKTAGLTVLLSAPAVPGFSPISAVAAPDADDNNYARYAFADVPTNTPLLITVRAGNLDGGGATVETVNAGFVLRADACAGEVVRNVAVLPQSLFDSYAAVMSPWDARRGLLLGRMTDCAQPAPRPIVHGVIGLALPPVPPGRVAYFADGGTLIPDLTRSDTSDNGYFLAAGLPACPNQVAFMARQGGTPRPLRTVDFIMPPGGAVIADLPPATSRLR